MVYLIDQLSRFVDYSRQNSLSKSLQMALRQLREQYYLSPLMTMERDSGTEVFEFTSTLFGFDKIRTVKRQNRYRVYNNSTGESYNFPTYPTVAQLSHVADNYKHYLKNKYSLPGFVEVEDGDVVVDVGAFVGAFSLYASDLASRVVAIEPGPDTYQCLATNVSHRDNVVTKHCAISDDPGESTLNLSNDPSDNSLIDVDSEDAGRGEVVPVRTLDDVLSHLGVEKVDFLKADAEGLEPEMVRSIEKTPVSKFAIDCSAERYGEDTVDEVTEILESRGYECKGEKRVFARR